MMTTTTTGLTTEDDDDDDIARKNFNLLAINDQVYNKLKILSESKNNARKIKCKTKKELNSKPVKTCCHDDLYV